MRILPAAVALLLGVIASSHAFGEQTAVDLAAYDAKADVSVNAQENALVVRWPIDDVSAGEVRFSLDPSRPLIAAMGLNDSPILRDIDPTFVLTVGTRDLSKAGWIVFFDNPPQRKYEAFGFTLDRKAARVVTEEGRTSIVFGGANAGPFSGELRFTFYPGGRLVRAAAVMSTSLPNAAYLYDTGLVARGERSWNAITWSDLSGSRMRAQTDDTIGDARPVQVRYRTIAAESENGSVAIVPPPHRFFYPLDFVDNLASAWQGKDWRGLAKGTGFGIRQTIEGDRRWVPWVNAPPESKQEMSVFYVLSEGDAGLATHEALAYTRNDTFKPLPGRQIFTSHYHVEHAVDLLNQQKKAGNAEIPAHLVKPEFVQVFERMGVNAVHLGEFHLSEGDMKVADRLTRLKTLHDECARLSNDRFLLMPGEEPNVHLGGHWNSFFPGPVMWTLDRQKDQPFEETIEPYGKVYHVGSAEDVLKLMEVEQGLMWTAHPRIKGSTGFPDVYRDKAFFQSDRYLGAAWKAMPADYSEPRLGSRVLNLLDDMNNWAADLSQRKQAPGEVDVFKISLESELYAHMNVNYLALDTLPKFADGWSPILKALRGGAFFTTTGEVLIPSFKIDGKSIGETLARPGGASSVEVQLEWTFPLALAELVSGDGTRVYRDRIQLPVTRAFGSQTISQQIDLRGRTWARLEVWDIATNGAYTQPVWIER